MSIKINTIVNEIHKYLDGLAATNTVCSALGISLSSGSNLFNYVEPTAATQCITIIPYGGSPPMDKDKQNPSVQIRIKAKKNETAMQTGQAIINKFHRNDSVCASKPGVIYANQSIPIFLPALEGGEFSVVVTNFNIRHVKF